MVNQHFHFDQSIESLENSARYIVKMVKGLMLFMTFLEHDLMLWFLTSIVLPPPSLKK